MTKYDKIFEKILKKTKSLIEKDEVYINLINSLKPIDLRDGVFYIQVENDKALKFISKDFFDIFLNIVRNEFDSKDLMINFVESPDFIKKVDLKKDASVSEFELDDSRETKLQNISENLTFDNFILTKEMKKIKESVLKILGNKYKVNRCPIFIYGNSGIGKTHLVNAVANHAYELNPNINIYYVTGVDLELTLSDIMRGEKPSQQLRELKQKFLANDMIIIDDFQMFAEKHISLKAFFDIFNEIKEKDIILFITSDRSVESINGLTDRFMSRLSGGIKLSMPTMNMDSRKEFVYSVIEKYNYDLDFEQDCLEAICDYYMKDIRSLIGALTTLDLALGITNFNGETPKATINDLISILDIKDIVKIKNDSPIQTNITPDLIINAISMKFNIKSDAIKGKGRSKDVVGARNLIFYILNKKLSLNHSQISEIFNKDRTTITTSLKKNSDVFDKDKKIQKLIDSIFKELHI